MMAEQPYFHKHMEHCAKEMDAHHASVAKFASRFAVLQEAGEAYHTAMEDLAQGLADDCDTFALPSKRSASGCEAPLAKYAVTLKELAGFQRQANASIAATRKQLAAALHEHRIGSRVFDTYADSRTKQFAAMSKFGSTIDPSAPKKEVPVKKSHAGVGRASVIAREDCNDATLHEARFCGLKFVLEDASLTR
jgi:hypothetical protein